MQARSLNFETDAEDEILRDAESEGPTSSSQDNAGAPGAVKVLAKFLRSVQLGAEQDPLKRHDGFTSPEPAKEGGNREGALATPVAWGATGHQRKRLYNQISQPPATPAIDFKEQKRDSWTLTWSEGND